MPVTVKLSRALSDHFGEQIADQILEWFDQVNQTYRNELRDLNELNFQRFSALLDERVGASEAKVEVRLSQFEQRMAVFESKIEQRMAVFESKIERRLTVFESNMEQRMAAFESNLEQRMGAFENRVDQRVAGLEATLERRLGEQTRWMFVAWAALLIPIIGLWFR